MLSTAKPGQAHGLDGKLVEPDWPQLSLHEVQAILERFANIEGPFEILRASPRPFSAACLVKAATNQVFVKRHHCTVRDASGLAEEHQFLRYLRERGASVPEVMVDANGRTALESGIWTYEVHSVPPGCDIYGDAQSWTPFRSANHARSAGDALARLHLGSAGLEAPRRMPHPLVASFTIFAADDPACEMARYLRRRPALDQDVRTRADAVEALRLLAPFHAELLPLLPQLPSLWTHNDLHASNLLWSDAGDEAVAAAIIDFGLSDRTNAVHDLAHCIERNIVEWLELVANPNAENISVHLDHLEALMEGYESVRSLSDPELRALAPMTALCHAEFALSEAHYFLEVLGSKEKAVMASNGWLVGHARWFHTPAGARLLDWLRSYAAQSAAGSPLR